MGGPTYLNLSYLGRRDVIRRTSWALRVLMYACVGGFLLLILTL